MMDVLAPNCPGCDQPPRMVIGAQAFCGSDDCQVFSWDITADPATFKATATVMYVNLNLDPPP